MAIKSKRGSTKRTRAKPTPYRSEANLEPAKRPEDLKRWWRPKVAGYLPFIVRVVARVTGKGRDLLTFELVDARAGGKSMLEVDLNDTTLVWPANPSTAQQAQPGEYGFLLLSKRYIRLNDIDAEMTREGGGKWPLLAGL